MIHSFPIKTLALTLALGAGTIVNVSAHEDKQQKIPFAELPAAVQKTIKEQAASHKSTVGEIERETEDGKVTYEADLKSADGKKLEVEVAADGRLIKSELEDKNDKDDKDDDKDKDEKD